MASSGRLDRPSDSPSADGGGTRPGRGHAATLAAAAGTVVMLLVLPACEFKRADDPNMVPCPERLENIGRALRAYHDIHGCFPPLYVADEHGRPMHSWRVLLLPYLGKKDLYEQYDFSEPWDGPHNRPLADVATDVYVCPKDAGGPAGTMTSYVAVAGPGTAWQGDHSTRLADCTDGPTSTIFLAEIADSGMLWTEPRDLNVIQMAPGVNPESGQGISSHHDGGAYVLMVSGKVRFLPPGIAPDQLKAMLTIAGGDEVGLTAF